MHLGGGKNKAKTKPIFGCYISAEIPEGPKVICRILAGSSGKILIGCGMLPGTFFTGLIDDVRIYNRAVQP